MSGPSCQSRPGHGLARAVLLIVGIGFLAVVVSAQKVVTVTLPSAVTFNVINVMVQTVGTPNPTQLVYTSNDSSLDMGIQVRADSNFVPPSGTAIPASRITWTTANAVNGTGHSGTLSTSSYVQVYSASNRANGSVNVTWRLSAPGTGIRAGAHTLTMRWRLYDID